jgi:maleylacetoacetate isomerase
VKLYSYWRSSASYRVRIALALKGISAEMIPVNLLNAEQKTPSYAQINPQMRLPALVDDVHVLTQSLAIIEYLDEQYPCYPLLPVTPHERARVRALALAVACDISPLNNLGPLNYLTQDLQITDAQKQDWLRHWTHAGFAAVEQMLSGTSGSFCHGATPTLADCCLIPQVYNARRFNISLDAYPTITRIDAACAKHPAFIAAHPAQQKDAM